MSVVYTEADAAVRNKARQLIHRHHSDLEEADVEVRVLFRSEAAKSNDKIVMGKAKKITGLACHLAGSEHPFFVVELAKDVWGALKPEQQEALLDHELSHCRVKWDEGKGAWRMSLASHDVEEFRSIIERHGFWDGDLQLFARTAKAQLALFDLPAEQEEGELVDLPGRPKRKADIDAETAAKIHKLHSKKGRTRSAARKGKP